MWKFIGTDGSSIIGVESRDYDDAEFLEVAERYEAINHFPAGSLAKSGLWEHDKKAGKPVTNEGG